MSDGRINLLPPAYGARARIRLLNKRIVIAVGVTATALVALAFHARMQRATAESDLVVAQVRAEEVLKAEQQEEALLGELDASKQRIESWRQVALPIPVGKILVTMTNLLPEEVVLDDMRVDVTGIRGGYRRDSGSSYRRVIGYIEGTAPDEASVRLFVEEMRNRSPFEEVRRGFTALSEEGTEVLTRFSVNFEVDLETRWYPAETKQPMVEAIVEQQP